MEIFFFYLELYVYMQNIYEILQNVNNMFEPNETRRIWSWLSSRNPLFSWGKSFQQACKQRRNITWFTL